MQMNTIFQNETVIIFIALAIIWLIGYIYIKRFDISSDKKFDLGIRNIAAMSVILVSYNIFISVRSNNRIEKNRITYNTLTNIQLNWLNPQQELFKSFPEGYFLYASMTPEGGFGTSTPKEYDSLKRKQLEVFYSIRIFQSMEDFLSTGSYDVTGSAVWLNNYLMWMQSPILRENWKNLNFNYSPDTRVLINRLIKKSDFLISLRKRKGHLESKDYDKISKKFKIAFR